MRHRWRLWDPRASGNAPGRSSHRRPPPPSCSSLICNPAESTRKRRSGAEGGSTEEMEGVRNGRAHRFEPANAPTVIRGIVYPLHRVAARARPAPAPHSVLGFGCSPARRAVWVASGHTVFAMTTLMDTGRTQSHTHTRGVRRGLDGALQLVDRAQTSRTYRVPCTVVTQARTHSAAARRIVGDFCDFCKRRMRRIVRLEACLSVCRLSTAPYEPHTAPYEPKASPLPPPPAAKPVPSDGNASTAAQAVQHHRPDQHTPNVRAVLCSTWQWNRRTTIKHSPLRSSL